MAQNTQKVGWIGMGRMGYAMAERVAKAGYDLTVWNRTRAKAEPLAAHGAKIADKVSDLANLDVVFSIVSTGKDLKQVYFGDGGLLSGNGKVPPIRGLRRDPREAESEGRGLRRLADLGQRQGHQGGQALGRRVGRRAVVPQG